MFQLRQHGGRYGVGKNHHLLEPSHHGLVAHYRRRVDLEHGDVLLYPRVHVASLAMIASALRGRIPLHRGDRVAASSGQQVENEITVRMKYYG